MIIAVDKTCMNRGWTASGTVHPNAGVEKLSPWINTGAYGGWIQRQPHIA